MGLHQDNGHPSASELIEQLIPVFQGQAVAGISLIEEPVTGSRHKHYTVVWDKWSHVDQQSRSKIILDAFERAQPVGEQWRVLEITLALGLTPDEARRLKIA